MKTKSTAVKPSLPWFGLLWITAGSCVACTLDEREVLATGSDKLNIGLFKS